MENRASKALIAASIILMALPVAFASASTDAALYNGGLGQVASDPASFGVAVCNKGPVALLGAVPIDIASNGQSIEVQSSATIDAGSCEYSYVNYSAFDMQVGTTYSVSVTIDHGTQATYNMTVPEVPASTTAMLGRTSELANINIVLGTILSDITHWVSSVVHL
jgi:hypothetical protein